MPWFNPVAVALLISLLWTVAFSLTDKALVRGWRNLGILAAYLVPFVALFWSHWQQVLLAWSGFSIAGGLAYTAWELVQRVRTRHGRAEAAGSPHSRAAGLRPLAGDDPGGRRVHLGRTRGAEIRTLSPSDRSLPARTRSRPIACSSH